MKEIPREQLIPGRFYFIEYLTQDNQGNIFPNPNLTKTVGIFQELKWVFPSFTHPWQSAVFHWIRLNDPSLFQKTMNESEVHANISWCREIELNYMHRFYEITKFKIQSDMEMRAVDKVLQNKIGDEHVKWIYV
jgi:hypothetical protein